MTRPTHANRRTVLQTTTATSVRGLRTGTASTARTANSALSAEMKSSFDAYANADPGDTE